MRPGRSPSSWTHGLRRPVTSTTAPAPRRRRVPLGQGEEVEAARGDVFAHLAGRQREAASTQLVVELGVDEVHLAQVGLVGSRPRASGA